MKRQQGFTVLELLVAIVFLTFAGTLFYIQKHDLEVADRDATRKTAINAMYYNLEEVYYAANGSYPKTISADNLKAMDPDLFTDPNGNAVGSQDSNYRYEPANCDGETCKSYTLRADLEKESDFVKASRH